MTLSDQKDENRICFIPARGGSKRIPRKNLQEVNGKSLLAYAIDSARNADLFDDICVSSDDEAILNAASQHGATMMDQRPAELAEDDVEVKDVCLEWLNRRHNERSSHYAVFCLLLTTNPLRRAQDVVDSYERFVTQDEDFLMSVRPFTHPPQRAVQIVDNQVEPYMGREKMLNTQKLETLYRHDGSLFWADIDAFLEQETQYGESVAAYEMPPERSVDIDEPLDLEWAEFLLQRLQNQGSP